MKEEAANTQSPPGRPLQALTFTQANGTRSPSSLLHPFSHLSLEPVSRALEPQLAPKQTFLSRMAGQAETQPNLSHSCPRESWFIRGPQPPACLHRPATFRGSLLKEQVLD